MSKKGFFITGTDTGVGKTFSFGYRDRRHDKNKRLSRHRDSRRST